jgi:multisubunit Na+/H+ antiporter MnhG subunit
LDFTRAFSYVFDDKQWTEKLVITVIMTFLAVIPLLGLVAVAALLGYGVELVQNVRDGRPDPLPRWGNYGDKIASGGNVLVAWIVYNILNFLVVCCVATVPGLIGNSEFFSSGFSLVALCCIFPALLVYNLFIWAMLAIGLVRYAEVGTIGVFFQFGDLFSTLNAHSRLLVQWVIMSLIAAAVLGFINIVPCIGWLASLALIFPVQGHLLGQLAYALDDKPKRKVKRSGY